MPWNIPSKDASVFSFLLKAGLFFPFDMLIILDLVELTFRPDDSCANIGVRRKVLIIIPGHGSNVL